MYKIKNITNKVFCDNSLKFLKKIPANSIDLVVTDPPYNAGKIFDKVKEKKYFDIDFHKKWLKECDRVIKPDGQIYVFWWPKFLKEMLDIFEHRQILFWTKPFARMMKLTRRWENFTELILWKTYSDEFTFNPFRDKRNTDYFNDLSCITYNSGRYHVTQKPISLIEQLILASSNPKDIVLDPFLGSGTTAIAAQNLDRKFIGIEISEEYINISKKRLKQKPLL